jgi:hypothetical protein
VGDSVERESSEEERVWVLLVSALVNHQTTLEFGIGLWSLDKVVVKTKLFKKK